MNDHTPVSLPHPESDCRTAARTDGRLWGNKCLEIMLILRLLQNTINLIAKIKNLTHFAFQQLKIH